MLNSEHHFSQMVSRRNFLRGAVAIGVSGVAVGVTEGGVFVEQNNVWEEASRPNPEFIENNEELLSHIHYGASFSPEIFGISLPDLEPESPRYLKKQEEMLRALDVVISDFGIRDIRLGIQWKNAESDGSINLDFYKPILDKCIEKDVNITLNPGAIKTFRYPEMHVPDTLLRSIPLPADGAMVLPQDDIARHAIDYVGRLYSKIHKMYDDDQRRHFSIIQPENEGFNPFGSKKWTMSNDYYRGFIALTHSYFPEADILLNSAGAKDLEKIRDVYQQVMIDNPKLSDKLIAGIDYYYLKPSSVYLPFVKPAIDPVTAAQLKSPFSMDDFTRHKIESPGIGIKTEITEAQSERWGSVTLPQESARGFRFKTLRMAPYTDMLERIWGIEEFAKRALNGTLTKENKEVIDLIFRINSRNVK